MRERTPRDAPQSPVRVRRPAAAIVRASRPRLIRCLHDGAPVDPHERSTWVPWNGGWIEVPTVPGAYRVVVDLPDVD